MAATHLTILETDQKSKTTTSECVKAGSVLDH
jgi:hypothetical protein